MTYLTLLISTRQVIELVHLNLLAFENTKDLICVIGVKEPPFFPVPYYQRGYMKIMLPYTNIIGLVIPQGRIIKRFEEKEKWHETNHVMKTYKF